MHKHDNSAEYALPESSTAGSHKGRRRIRRPRASRRASSLLDGANDLWPSFFRPHSAARAHFLLFQASFISFKKKQKKSGLQNGLQEPSFHDMTKVAYVLRFRHVEFTTLQNQLIFYQKKCWLRSVVNAILQIC